MRNSVRGVDGTEMMACDWTMVKGGVGDREVLLGTSSGVALAE